jgi:hypothetical protein
MKSLNEVIAGIFAIRNTSSKFRSFKTIFAASVFGIFSLAANGQNEQNAYNNQRQSLTDQSLIQAIAPYKEDVRNDILIATQYPDVLQQIAQIRDNTTRGFRQIIQDYPQKKQNWFYEVSRYPDLMDKLASMPRRSSSSEIETLLPNNSPELKEAAWKLYANHHKDLINVASLNQEAVISFQSAIKPLSRNAQNAFRTLEDMPDVLSLLNDHIDIAARLGERFQNDPAALNQEIADANDHINNQNQEDLSAYKDELAQDPQAIQELSQASQAYASTGGYSYPAPTGDKVVNYGSPYSYWFGYPSWYGYPMWYPGAFGYGSGIYLGLGGYGSIYGLPSLGFSRWFFGGAYRNYPHLYRRYDSYYRNYAARNGYISPNRNAFMGTARRYFNPGVTGRSDGFNNTQAYRQVRPAQSQNYRMAPQGNGSFGRSNSGSYSRPSFGGGYSRGSSFGGGGFHGGGGMRGGRH